MSSHLRLAYILFTVSACLIILIDFDAFALDMSGYVRGFIVALILLSRLSSDSFRCNLSFGSTLQDTAR